MATELETWEGKLRKIFKEIDAVLEEKYGSFFPRNPVRARHGSTSSPESDGLFDVGAAYSTGLGSAYGEGYAVEVRWATLSQIPENLRIESESIVENILNRRLPDEFPGKNLKVVRDGTVMKIVGNLSLT
ncbi:MAG: hypothetical protein WCS96_07210 [Victivallales bacterium]|jgi:hypothetical protein